MSVVVAPATRQDADAIRSLEGLTPATARLLDRELGADDRITLVARHGGEVVGYAAATCHLDERGIGCEELDSELLDVVVAPAWRRRGIGARLVAEVVAATRSRGAHAVTLEVREGNDAAIALYRSLGFSIEGRRPGYYPDGEAALIMWCRVLHRDPAGRAEGRGEED